MQTCGQICVSHVHRHVCAHVSRHACDELHASDRGLRCHAYGRVYKHGRTHAPGHVSRHACDELHASDRRLWCERAAHDQRSCLQRGLRIDACMALRAKVHPAVCVIECAGMRSMLSTLSEELSFAAEAARKGDHACAAPTPARATASGTARPVPCRTMPRRAVPCRTGPFLTEPAPCRAVRAFTHVGQRQRRRLRKLDYLGDSEFDDGGRARGGRERKLPHAVHSRAHLRSRMRGIPEAGCPACWLAVPRRGPPSVSHVFVICTEHSKHRSEQSGVHLETSAFGSWTQFGRVCARSYRQ